MAERSIEASPSFSASLVPAALSRVAIWLRASEITVSMVRESVWAFSAAWAAADSVTLTAGVLIVGLWSRGVPLPVACWARCAAVCPAVRPGA